MGGGKDGMGEHTAPVYRAQVDSMPASMTAVLKVRGGNTKY